MGKKSDKAEIAKRIEEVLRIRLDGAQFHDIVQYGSEKGWNVTDRQMRKYISRADELLVERQDKSRKKVIARHLAQRQSLFARAVNAADYRTALAILADEAKLRGLYPEKELRELLKLAAAQGLKIAELEGKINVAYPTGETPPPTAPASPSTGPPGITDAGGTGGKAGGIDADPALLMRDAGFAPDPWQEALLRSESQRTLMLCARQVGKSRTVSILALHTALTKPGSLVTIVSPGEEQSIELLRKVSEAYHRVGEPVPLKGESVTKLELKNGSRVLALPGKESRMRSYTSSLLLIDEAARVPDSVMNAASPTMAVSKGRFVALSTAFAKSGWFYKGWEDLAEPYHRLSITAPDCPRITPEFLASERRRLGERWFNMEYLNIFGDDVAAVFSSTDIQATLRDTSVKPLFFKRSAA